MEQAKTTALVQVKNMLSQETVKAKFTEVLGAKAPQFMASITNAISSNSSLAKCEPKSIMGAAFVAATFDLPIDSNLGFSYIVPYNNKSKDKTTGQWVSKMEAQFQIGHKGFIQLAIRSGEYESMNYSSVYEDELVSYNPITGEVEVTKDFQNCTQRMNGETDKIVGYYAWFKLKSGFRHELYMSKIEIQEHARKYSQSYRYDIEKGKTASNWSNNFDAMAKKTVIKLLLSKWGILSIDMQRAINDDQKVFDDKGEGTYEDNKDDVVEVVDAFATEVPKEKIEGIADIPDGTTEDLPFDTVDLPD